MKRVLTSAQKNEAYKALVAALNKMIAYYAKHLDSCATISAGSDCTCGYDATLGKIKEAAVNL